MTPRSLFATCAIAPILLSAAVVQAQSPLPPTATVTVDFSKPGVAIPPSFYGLMTEEINHSYDGGLYAELIQNRTFQDNAKAPAHWSLIQPADGAARISLDREYPVNKALPVSLRMDLAGSQASLANDGYWGIPVRPDTKYTATFYAKASGGFSGPVTASIFTDDAATPVASAQTTELSNSWQKYTLVLTTAHDAPTTAHAKFFLSATGAGAVSFSLVSLFPPTYMDHPNGLRPDLMKLMADMHPGFIRLPGGNYLEGDNFPNRFDWKKMIGPIDQRPGHMGCWGYRSSDGFGLPEYLLWCKQLHAEPVLAVFAGYTLKHDHVTAGPKLQQYVDEALQEIEYVSGPADSAWGKRRAADGFPDPFPLHYVEIGNEDFFDRSGSYDGRFAQFYDAIKARYPHLNVIATTPVKSRKPDLVDDHFCRSPRQMAADEVHYDKTTRQGPQIFVGEWASQEGRPLPDLNAALGDAVWMMGLERNADLVPIQCYAPLLCNVNPHGWEWPTNLIGYDALTSFGSPSYYVQCIFGQNKGNVVLPVTLTAQPKIAATEPAPHGSIGVGTWHTNAEYKDITVFHGSQVLLKADLAKDTRGWQFTGDKWNLQDAAIRPSAADSETWATTGNPVWTDYTLRLKARKVAGNEGFLILFHVVDGENYSWWNIGGWGNTATQCAAAHSGSRQAFGPSVNVTVDTGKWYDIRIEVQGHRMRGYIDGKLVTDATEPPEPTPSPIFATASYASDTREVILKLVNLDKDPATLAINLRGINAVSPTGKAIVLTGSPRDVNSIDEPTKVAPREEQLVQLSPNFQRSLPPYSLTLLRFGAGPQ